MKLEQMLKVVNKYLRNLKDEVITTIYYAIFDYWMSTLAKYNFKQIELLFVYFKYRSSLLHIFSPLPTQK